MGEHATRDLIKFRSELEERIASRLLAAVEQLAGGCDPPNIFRVWKDGQVWAVPPDKVEGIFEAILHSFRKMRSWDALTSAQGDAAQARKQTNRAIAKQRELERRIQLLESQFENHYELEDSIDTLLAEWWRARVQNPNGRWRGYDWEFRALRELRIDLMAIACTAGKGDIAKDAEIARITALNTHQVQRMIHLTILAVGCSKHPSYRAKRKITTLCEDCIRMWAASQALKEMAGNG